MSKARFKESGECQGCGRRYTVTRFGRPWFHRDTAERICPGVDQPAIKRETR